MQFHRKKKDKNKNKSHKNLIVMRAITFHTIHAHVQVGTLENYTKSNNNITTKLLTEL